MVYVHRQRYVASSVTHQGLMASGHPVCCTLGSLV